MKRGIIVSIQGYQHGTTNELASEAARAGAVAIRTDKPVRLQQGIEAVPIIGLHKLHVREPSREPYMTSSIEALEAVARWADLVAVDCRRCNVNVTTLLSWCVDKKVQVVADIETVDDWRYLKTTGLPYAFVATTFSVFHMNHRPDIRLVEELLQTGERNIIAEGNYSSREDVRRTLKAGAKNVCIGAAVSNVYKLARKYTTIEY